MSRGKVKFAWIGNQRARRAGLRKRMNGLMKKAYELTILCNMSACLIFFSREENKMVAWPSHEEAKALINAFYSLPDLERKTKAVDQESYIKTNMKKVEKKLADIRKANTEREMDHLMFQLHNGRILADLSDTEIDKLISYSSKKIMSLRKELGSTEPLYASVNEPSLGDEIPRDSNVSFEGFRPMGSGSIYIMDKWISGDCNVQNHGDDTLLPSMVTGLDLNMEPSDGDGADDYDDDDDDDDDGMEICKGESSNSGGADDA